MLSSNRRQLALVAMLAALALTAGTASAAQVERGRAAQQAVSAQQTTEDVTYQERYRPQFHFTPAINWMNDPNGLIWHRGEYHLFYQYNPVGTTWGEISWGHAVSRDLVHWDELGVAIPADDEELVFSGTAVVDHRNTSGFGSRGRPPMVAIYTSAYRDRPIQAQSLAYSTDNGRTWTKYEGNPVLDIGSGEFRDPKVFWYAEDARWIMAVTLSQDRKVSFYGSDNLKDWEHLSDFGPANAQGGVWEVPDLFELPIDGDPNNTKWVLVVNLNPGGIAGGSGAQYFIGEWDGTEFHAENIVDELPPDGMVFEDFERDDWGDWEVTGEAFGHGPARGTLPGQMPVSGWLGDAYVNSFHGGDITTGTLTSPTFTIEHPHINFLVAGGAHEYDPRAGDGTPPDGEVFEDFEWDAGETFEDRGWTATGDFEGEGPAEGAIGGQMPVSGYLGERLVNTFIDGDQSTGTIMSPDFEVTSDYINLLVGGGPHQEPGNRTAVDLVIDGEIVHSASGRESETLNWVAWDVSDYQGETARIEIIDEHSGGWGHILADHIMFSDESAQPRQAATAVNLVVDGEVVRTASGQESEWLDWESWNVEDLIGEEAHIQIVDHHTGGWGHILADHFMFSDEAAESITERSDWVDWGRDFYAAISFENVPSDRRILIAWMSNWQYAGVLPTSPWRSAMSLPRELSLGTVDGQLELIGEPINQLRRLRTGPVFNSRDQVIEAGSAALESPGRRGEPLTGKTLEIVAELEPGSADRFGLKVRTGEQEETIIGYDIETSELYVDRTRSGNVDFSAAFPSVQRAPLQLDDDGVVRLHVFVDWSSVEVFAGAGHRIITDRIFPDPDSDGVELFAEGGDAHLRSLRAWPLKSIWGSRAN